MILNINSCPIRTTNFGGASQTFGWAGPSSICDSFGNILPIQASPACTPFWLVTEDVSLFCSVLEYFNSFSIYPNHALGLYFQVTDCFSASDSNEEQFIARALSCNTASKSGGLSCVLTDTSAYEQISQSTKMLLTIPTYFQNNKITTLYIIR